MKKELKVLLILVITSIVSGLLTFICDKTNFLDDSFEILSLLICFVSVGMLVIYIGYLLLVGIISLFSKKIAMKIRSVLLTVFLLIIAIIAFIIASGFNGRGFSGLGGFMIFGSFFVAAIVMLIIYYIYSITKQ